MNWECVHGRLGRRSFAVACYAEMERVAEMKTQRLIAALLVLTLVSTSGCRVVSTRPDSASNSPSENSDASVGSFLLGAVVLVGSVFLSSDDDDDHCECECKDDDKGFSISFD